MPRVRVVEMDGLRLAVAAMPYEETQRYVSENQAMIARKASAEEWEKRKIATVASALNKPDQRFGGAPGWDVRRVRSELDVESIERLHSTVLEMSGLSKSDAR